MPIAQPEYRITGPIPLPETPSQDQASALRLCVFMNVLQTIYYLASGVKDAAAEGEVARHVRAAHQIVTTLLLMGVLKEGSDAMRDFASQIDKVVAGLAKGPVDHKPIVEAWTRIKTHIDKGDLTSLYCRQLDRARHKAAFHWARAEVEKICKQEEGPNAPFAILREGGGDVFTSVRFLLADEILGRIAFPDAGSDEVQRAVAETREFAVDVILALGTVLPAYFRERGCFLEPFNTATTTGSSGRS